MDENNRAQQDVILSIEDLFVQYVTDDGLVEAVNGVSFDIKRGETLGLVGETGAGKTTIALAVMRLLESPPARIAGGCIRFEGRDLNELSDKEIKKIRGNRISMIFQDPMTALNPVIPVIDQVAETLRIHNKISKLEAMAKATEVLEMVGIHADRHKEYPHQFSGGMKQRVVIAVALTCNPELLIADEPTTALDVTIQAQVLELMKDLRTEMGTSMLMITHDLGVIAEMCDKCAIMYAGQIVEYGSLEQIFDRAMHPYTKGLFSSLPPVDQRVRRLAPIKGLVCDPMRLPDYCNFYDRCDACGEDCRTGDPKLIEVEPGHFVRCFHCGKGGC